MKIPVRAPVEGDAFELDDAAAGRLQMYRSGSARRLGAADRPVLLIHTVNAAASAYEIRPLFSEVARSRPVYALDLPGFGWSDRSPRAYTARLMTDAVLAAVRAIRAEHANAAVDALGVSTGCEFLARAATEEPDLFRSLALVSPTGMAGSRDRYGPAGATFGRSWLLAVLRVRLWSRGLFGLLTRPGVVRYFLRRTYGRSAIDDGLWSYAVQTAQHPEARHAPLYFLAGYLFSRDVSALYDRLDQPVWLAHGVRGDFTDYRGADRILAERTRWTRHVFDTGALPHFEDPDVAKRYVEFLGSV